MPTEVPAAGRSRAVVIGGSIAGLIAARVLSDRLDEVVIVERDSVDDNETARPGVPQAMHVHVLLRRGYLELTRLYPDLDGRLAAAGAPALDLLRDGAWIMPAGEVPRFRSRLRTRSASRTLYESVIRALTLERPNVRLVDGHEVIGLVGNATAVRGVALRARPAPRVAPASSVPVSHTGVVHGPPVEMLELGAWLVVDASGRTSRAPEHLAAIGAPVPEETVIDASLRYATRHYRVSDGPRDWKVLMIRDRPPSSTRGGVATQVEGQRWVVTLSGAGKDQPPTDEDGFAEFARHLISPRLFDVIRDAEPLSDVRGWARTANRWRHVERLRLPDGYALIGDALCALNPVYGQGLSVAAMEGGVLGRWLDSSAVQQARRWAAPPDTRRLIRAFAHSARLPWFLATSEDVRIDGVAGAPDPGALGAIGGRYVDAVLLDAVRSPRTLRRFSEVNNLVRHPVALLDPVILARVAASAVSRRLGARHAR